MNFWQVVSRFILKQRILILLVLAALTVFLASKIDDIKFSHSEANLLPEDHIENLKYNEFIKTFVKILTVVFIA